MASSLWMNALAPLLCGAGVYLLWRSWRGRKLLGGFSAAGGWLSVLAGIFIWASAAGGEFGTSYALIAVSLVAWIICALGVERRQAKPARNVDVAVADTLGDTSRWHKWGTFVTAGPIACVATCLVTVALSGLLPFASGNRMAFAALAYPLAWGAASVWICASAHLARNALILLAVAAVAAVFLFM
ncbi:hypothetical protein [Microbulbifer taiwanensis]|uniref:LysE family transporter n=1 Tax=Microbulbifer taiwanensis TaxID=986746 RepID=A0ABW1YHF5_9GAMM|nr:hypothetical protein [Microbulbifer taiwanensis]